MKRWTPIALAAAWLVESTAMSAPGYHYVVAGATVTDLGTFGGPEGMAWDINNGGYIVGWATNLWGERHAFYYLSNASYLYDIGLNTGLGPSEARGINSSNVAVGHAIDATGVAHAFRWFAGSWAMLADAGPPGTGDVASRAEAISDFGVIVGHRQLLQHVYVTYLPVATLWLDYDVTTFHTLERPQQISLGIRSFAHDVNLQGQVVGRGEQSGRPRIWMWEPPNPITGVSATVNGVFASDFLGINAGGAVVGYDSIQGHPHAFFWIGVGSPLDLGTFLLGDYSVAEDINNANFVAGYGDQWVLRSNTWINFESAFIYHANFGKYELPKFPGLGDSDCRAHALNERQSASGLIQVVGYCKDANGYSRAVRWDVTVALVRLQQPGPTP